ncbi:hypothetical protein SISNIDRAFT_460810 [Sistotremastrum niveocremeum HHB9708]|uniref:Uncharacterized protein n=2 Tax=Sistotremastraceae TaxID=3402574 RepID=A0A164NAJ3_9AGAM|nr:hypothetical protein SISNIDRAFT_460810 [Sistotremastrum niveocremeum HHB9708]KZT38120.1 hypothetical protein SISSUDRAFT_1047484 [Sistotremastrum suecicum HHB10207 ss-3]
MSDITWNKTTSQNGAAFEFGTSDKISSAKTGQEALLSPHEIAGIQANVKAAASTGVTVKWEVGDGKMKATSQSVKDIGISEYALIKQSNTVYTYRLDFTNTKGWGFNFKDESGDKYTVTTFRNGGHMLQYNSDKPTIVLVQ